MMTKEQENEIPTQLPPEIISRIFSYLPATAKKQARLVCSAWYKASKILPALKHQTFVYNGYVFYDQLETMLNMVKEYSYLNLKFLKPVLNDPLFESFIISNGSRIHSLIISDCYFTFGMLQKIMIHCTALKRLSLIHPRFDDCEEESADDSEDMDDTFDHVSQESKYHGRLKFQLPKVDGEKIIRNRLTTLELRECHWFLSHHIFAILISAYPRIKELILPEIGASSTSKILPGYNYVGFQHFYQIIGQNCHQIEKLNIHMSWPLEISDEQLTDLASLPCLRLTEIHINSYNDLLTYSGIMNFLTRQSNITTLNVSDLANFDFDWLLFILQHIPNLECLRISSPQNHDPPSTQRLLQLLATSRLKIFECSNIRNYSHPQQTFDSSMKNCTMEQLTVREGDNIIIPMLEMFPNLTYLDLTGANIRRKTDRRRVTSYIFQSLVNLRTLILNSCGGWINDQSFQDYKILPYLENLQLKYCTKLTEMAIYNFNFPKLIILDLGQCHRIHERSIVQLARASPLLEWLCIQEIVYLHSDELINICSELKFIRYLDITTEEEDENLNEDKAIEILENLSLWCPSLRVTVTDIVAARLSLEMGFVYNYFNRQWLRSIHVSDLMNNFLHSKIFTNTSVFETSE